MSDDLVLRELRQGDLPRLLEIAVAAWRPIFASFRQAYGDELFEMLHPDWEEAKRRQIRSACEPDNPAGVFVAEAGGVVVGFITFAWEAGRGIAEIGNNAVHPDFQGRGIGPRMYAFVFERLRERGVRFVKVTTGGDPSHAPARRAYEKAGFATSWPWVDYWRKL